MITTYALLLIFFVLVRFKKLHFEIELFRQFCSSTELAISFPTYLLFNGRSLKLYILKLTYVSLN